jgi:hypothetical protein
MPLGEEADEEAADALVRASDQAVDCLVLLGNSPLRFPAASGTSTTMDASLMVFLGLRH